MVESLTPEDVSRWLSAVTATNTQCWVENPESVKESGFMTSKSFTTYRVLLKASDGELTACRHRFSDFQTLRDNLKAKFFSYGLIVPALPPKKLTGTQDKEFLTERMQGLSLLCEEIVSFPWFRKDPLWKSFMGQPSACNPAPEDILTYMCSRLPLPYLPLERLVEVKEQVVIFEKKLKGVLDNLKHVQSSLKQLQNATSALKLSFDSLQEDFTASNPERCKFLNGDAEEMTKDNWSIKLRDSEKIPAILSAVGNMVTEKVGYNANTAEYTNILFHSYLEREAARCGSIRELMKYHDDLSISIDNIRVNIEKLESKKAQTDKVKWQINDAKTELEEKKFLMNTFYKGFFYFTLPLSVKNRSENMRKMAECVAAFELIEGTCQQQSASKVLATVNASAIQAVSDTRTMLDLLGVCPLNSIDHEELLLGELGILPGMAMKPSSDWLLEIYKTYSEQGDAKYEQDEREEEILTPPNRRVSTHSPVTTPPRKSSEDEENEPEKDTVMAPSSTVEDVTLDLQQSNLNANHKMDDKKEKETAPAGQMKPVVSDNLNILTSSLSADEEKALAEKNMSSLFGD